MKTETYECWNKKCLWIGINPVIMPDHFMVVGQSETDELPQSVPERGFCPKCGKGVFQFT